MESAAHTARRERFAHRIDDVGFHRDHRVDIRQWFGAHHQIGMRGRDHVAPVGLGLDHGDLVGRGPVAGEQPAQQGLTHLPAPDQLQLHGRRP
jgi:hypothetical protein